MPASTDTVVSALAANLAEDPGRPLVTFYDGATGERIELSVKTLDNWVTKVANLFGDELMLEPGDEVRVDLPTHWLSIVTVLGAWTAGLRLSLRDSSLGMAVSVVGPAARTSPDAVIGRVIACSLRPLGGPFLDPLPHAWLDFGVEVPGQPDALLNYCPVDGADVAVEDEAGQVSHAQLVSRAIAIASGLDLSVGGRLLTDVNPSRPSGLDIGLVAPLAAGSSIVLVTNCGSAMTAAIAAQERVTRTYVRGSDPGSAPARSGPAH